MDRDLYSGAAGRFGRESDSLDDFEHLEKELSPSKEQGVKEETARFLADLVSFDQPLPPPPEAPPAPKLPQVETGDFLDLDDFTGGALPPPVPPHADAFRKENLFMDTEREELLVEPSSKSSSVLAERYSDSEPDVEEDDLNRDFRFEDLPPPKPDLPQKVESFVSHDPTKIDTYRDVIEDVLAPVLPERDYLEELLNYEPKPAQRAAKGQKGAEITGVEAVFCKMGLDAWFCPEKLDPRVESLIYWRDPKKSGAVFGGILLLLFSLAYFSLISVVAYVSLLALSGAAAFRIYKSVLQAVQKTSDGHPFKDLMDINITVSPDKAKEVAEWVVTYVNVSLTELRRLFLVEDFVDSTKFGVILWLLTYLGAWFNGMTILILAVVAMFTLPKVYETNKTNIDANLDIVRGKLTEITSKIKAAIPIGKKSDDKKEQ